jgi:hypothetical protein
MHHATNTLFNKIFGLDSFIKKYSSDIKPK